jgi:hypothetical protein
MSEFARRMKVSRPVISRGVADGRLKDSVGVDSRGRPVITNVTLARREWKRNASAKPTNGTQDVTLSEARRLLTLERQKALEIANAVKLGELVSVVLVERDHFEAMRTVRDSMLNIPDRVAAELAAESSSTKVHARLDAEIRQALDSTAKRLA